MMIITRWGRLLSRGSALALALALASLTRVASAHPIGLSRGEYLVTTDGLDVTITVGRTEALAMVPSLDGDRNDTVDDRELADARDDLARYVVAPVHVVAGHETCVGALTKTEITESDALVVRAHYRCANPPATTVTLAILDDLARGHRHSVHAVAGSVSKDELCFQGHASFTLPEALASEVARPVDAAPWTWASPLRFVRMGFEHVLGGYDHLVFLFALLLIGGRLRSLLWTTTAFTLGHSVTLALATFGVLSLPGRLVECAIALSVAYVGLENLVSPRSDRRWRLTLVFGMVHGFGFASALAELGLSRAAIAPALLTFNLGVEAAQLVAMAVFVPVVWGLRAVDRSGKRLAPALSVAITVLGLVWFVDRLQSDPAEPRSGAADPGSAIAVAAD